MSNAGWCLTELNRIIHEKKSWKYFDSLTCLPLSLL